MPDYDKMLKEQLRALCAERELPVSGTNDELIARLRGWDDAHSDEPDLLVAAGLREPAAEQSPPPVDPQTRDEPTPQPVREDPPAEGESAANQTVFRSRYEMTQEMGEVVPNEEHQRWIATTEQAAINAGHRIRGGACRIDFETDGGKRYAVYQVILGRSRQDVK